MPNDAREATLAYRLESTFREGPVDWDAGGDGITTFTAIDPDWSGLVRTTVENRGHRRRAYATRQKLQGLNNAGTFGFGLYASGSASATANNAAAASFVTADLLQVAWKGLHLGYASAIVTPSTTVPELTAGQGANHPAGAAIFGIAASGAGQFAIVQSVAVDVLTLRTTLDAAATAVGAVIVCYPHTRALLDRSHPSHSSISMYFRGEEPEDNAEALGCALEITSLDNTEAGSDPEWKVDGKAASFDKLVARADLTATPQAPVGPIVGVAGTAVRVANVGTPTLVDVGAYTFQFAPGVKLEQVAGVVPSGVQGWHGQGIDDTMLTITVPYDDQWITDFEAGTRKHVLIQIGDEPGDAWGIYLPNAEIADDPQRGASADETSMTIVLRALEYEGNTHTEGDDEYELERAKFLVLMSTAVAP